MCGGPGPLTDEHVISKTVRRQMPLLSGVTRTFAGHTSRPQNVLHIVLRRAVCPNCNGGWMHQLEDDFVALVGPKIARPEEMVLDPAQQERVATWAIKTALLLEVWTCAQGRGSYVPVDNLRWLASHQSPPAFAQVWMAGVDSRLKRLAWSQSGFLAIATGERVACLATFTVGHLGFQVFARDIEDPNHPGTARSLAPIDPPQEIRDATVCIWPTVERALWPPGKTILGLEALPNWAGWLTVLYASPPSQ